MAKDPIDDGIAHLLADRLGAAEAVCRAVLARDPNRADAWHLLGEIAHHAQQLPRAADALARAIALRGDVANYHLSLANVLRGQGRLAESIAAYHAALRLKPDHADALLNLGTSLVRAGQPDAAAKAWEALLRVNPRDADALGNLASVHREAGRLGDALRYAERALQLAPHNPGTLVTAGTALEQQGRLAEAIVVFRRAIELAPESPGVHSSLLLALNYHGTILSAEVFAEHVRWGERHGKPPTGAPVEATTSAGASTATDADTAAVANTDTKARADAAGTLHARAGGGADATPPRAHDRTPGRRLRVGYFSPDFREHPVAFFLDPILTQHDRAAFEITCYSETMRPDAMTERLKRCGHAWRDTVGVRDDDLCAQMRRDGIDILVDLAGHTADNRLPLFARRPAPVQTTYLGYPNTTGLTAIDWRITDALADPPGMTDAYHTERLLRLPRCAWCFQPPEGLTGAGTTAPSTLATAQVVDSARPLTFGSFNNHAKISAATLDAWAALLKAVDDSHLVLKSTALRDPETRQRALAEFAARGVAAGRVELIEPTRTLAEHYAAYDRVDVALDTFPYNGTTTTCDALWRGVPVVALAGRTHASRVGLSLLCAVGLADLVGVDVDDYVRIAAALAGDRGRLAELRSRLPARVRSSPLADAAGMARAMESAFRTMWHARCRTQT